MPGTVLVVDDIAEAAAALARVCEAAGFRARVLTDSRLFRAAFAEEPPVAVILDVMMPDQDGIEILREIAELAPGTPGLVVTGQGELWARMARDIGTILGLTHVAMAAKPVGRALIVEFLGQALGPAAADSAPTSSCG